MGKFFGSSCRESNVPAFEPRLTFLLVPQDDDSGRTVMVSTCVDTSLGALALTSFTDYSIGELLKHGINPKALNNSADRRLGSDAEIEAFCEYVDSVSDKLFNVKD